DEYHEDCGVGGAGHHMPGVLDVAWGVGEDELPLGGGEVAVGDVDGYPLLPLGPQAVGEQRQVEVIGSPPARRLFDRLQLVLEDLLRVVQQAPDQRRLAVVHRAGRGEPDELHVLEVRHGGHDPLLVRWWWRARAIRNTPPACGPPWQLR